MANHSATKKNIRKIAARTAHRRSIMSAVKTAIRNLNEAIVAGDEEKVTACHKQAQSHIMKAQRRNLLHKNTASRKIARLTKKMKK